MLVYRIVKTKYAKDLTGEGARLNGGRWNNKHMPCIYTSESRALALLEFTVNVNIDEIPRALSLVTLTILTSDIFEITDKSLPGNWKLSPAPASTKDFGSNTLKELKYPVLKIPSVIINEEFNYILNPLHIEAAKFKITDIRDFVFDVRLKLAE